jgi:putative transposase
MVKMDVRYSYRVRTSRTAKRLLLAEWDRDRWVWNQCTAPAKELRRAGEKCGPAHLDKELTGWRAQHPWLAEGSSVAQQQTVRDFGAARSKAIKDIKDRLPMKRRRGFPKFKKKDLALPLINYTRRGFSLKDGRLHLAGGISLGIVWSRDLPSEPTSVRISRDATGRWWASFVVKVETEPLLPVNRVIGIDWGGDRHRHHHRPGLRPPPQPARKERRCQAGEIPTHDGPKEATQGSGPLEGVQDSPSAGGQRLRQGGPEAH